MGVFPQTLSQNVHSCLETMPSFEAGVYTPDISRHYNNEFDWKEMDTGTRELLKMMKKCITCVSTFFVQLELCFTRLW